MVAQMDDKNRALCFYYRNPPAGQKKLKFSDIAKLVKNTDGESPTAGAVRQCVVNFHTAKGKRGRKEGWRKTTKLEDKKVLEAFHKIRPPGHGVDSRAVHMALPKKVRDKIGRRTVIRRLAEKRYTPTKKVQKSDPGPALAKRRVSFTDKHKRSKARWNAYLQAVGDIREFTYYPRELRPKFKQLRAPWTYMRPEEKYKPAFVRPKKWFKRSDYKKVLKQKVFGMTTSTGKCLAILLPKPFTAEKWGSILKKRVYPFLKKAFPSKRQCRVLLDGESVLRAEAVQAVMAEKKMLFLEDWPKYSPDLNPQENVWPAAEEALRAAEEDDDTFQDFQKRCVKAVKEYVGAKRFVGP